MLLWTDLAISPTTLTSIFKLVASCCGMEMGSILFSDEISVLPCWLDHVINV